MKAAQEQVQTSTSVNDEIALEADELKALAKLLDVLMEADFQLNTKERILR